MADEFRFLQQPTPEPEAAPGSEVVDLGALDDIVKLQPDALVVDLPDGAVTINFGPFGINPSEDANDHDVNLANYVDAGTLGGISDDLIRLITDDMQRQEQRLSDIVKGIDLLGIKLEEPKSEPNDEGMSVVKHPLLLEIGRAHV